MKLEKWALLAEVVSGAAIVLTLVILILEVRANTDLSRATAYQAVTRDFDEYRAMVLTNPELLDILTQVFEEDKWPEENADPKVGARIRLMVASQFSASERAYVAYRAGIIGEQEWIRISRAMCAEFAQTSGDLREQLSFRLTPEFVGYLLSECESL